MAIVFGIIKVIFIIILILLALLLILTGLILFAPIRYRLKGSFHDGMPCGTAEAKWLCGVIGFRASAGKDEKACAYISVCGFKIQDLSEDECEEGTADESSAETFFDNKASPADAAADTKVTVSYESKRTATTPKRHIDTVGEELSINAVKGRTKAGTGRIKEFSRRIADRISKFIDELEARLKALLKSAAEALKKLKTAYDKRSGQLKALKALWQDERFLKGRELLTSRILKLLKELKPRKGCGYLRLGFDDPYTTGQAMMLASLLYPLYAEHIDMIPDFDREIIDGELDIRGRIRAIVPAEAALRVFFNKQLRAMYKKARRILELDT